MRKVILFVLLAIFAFVFTGCITLERATLKEVKFYDLEGNEIVGEYMSIFEWADGNQLQLSQSRVAKLNSPAPIVNMYFAEVELGSTVQVLMKFEMKRYKMKSLTLTSRTNDEISIVLEDSVKVEGKYTVVTYVFENISETNRELSAASWIDTNGESHWFQRTGGRTYIQGFGFVLSDENADDL